jgi:hypothetical protein
VKVERRFTHPVMKKTIRRSKNYHAHDEPGTAGDGSRVRAEASEARRRPTYASTVAAASPSSRQRQAGQDRRREGGASLHPPGDEEDHPPVEELLALRGLQRLLALQSADAGDVAAHFAHPGDVLELTRRTRFIQRIAD